MIKIILFLLLVYLNIFATQHIQKSYYIDSRDINSTLFFKNKEEITLYKIPKSKHSLRIRKDQLEKLFKQNGFNDFEIDSRYVYFELNSPIDTTKLKNFLKEHYKNKYASMKINHISIKPRSYMEQLPKSYTIDIRSRSHLANEGVVSIEDDMNRKYFFNYKIDAKVNVLKATKKILRGEEITPYNSKVHTIEFQRFYSIPLQKLYRSEFQAKYHIDKDDLILTRDLKKLDLVKEDTQVSVSLHSDGIAISFSARALQSGKLNDIITIQKRNGRKLKARVVAKQRVEIK